MCVCVCLSHLRYPEWEVVLPRCLHYLKWYMYAWWLAQTAFQAYMTCGSREKFLKCFCQLLAESLACTVTLPVPLDKLNSSHYNKVFRTFSKGTCMCWRTHPPYHCYHSWYCFILYTWLKHQRNCWNDKCASKVSEKVPVHYQIYHTAFTHTKSEGD